ncbi:MAG: hypothetical protein ACRD0U_13035 [Acidimicrobiales bacterium]
MRNRLSVAILVALLVAAGLWLVPSARAQARGGGADGEGDDSANVGGEILGGGDGADVYAAEESDFGPETAAAPGGGNVVCTW